MKIGNLVRTDFEVISPEVAISDLSGLLSENTYLVVKEHNKFKGILSSHQKFLEPHRSAGHYLDFFPEIDFNSTTSEVTKILQTYGLVTAPVFDSNGFVGVILLHDIVKALTDRCSDLEDELDRQEKERGSRIGELKAEIEEYKQLVGIFTKYKHSIEKILETKSNLLADVSHEIRNPLHVILSYAKKGQVNTDKDENKTTYQYFTRIKDSGEKILILVNDLLDLSKLEAGKPNYRFEKVNLFELTELVVEEYQLILESKLITCDIKKPEDDVFARGDCNRIMQVIRNLLSNACKFSPDQSHVRIELYRLHNEAGFSITDWGYGIPKDRVGELFTKYSRSSESEIQGTGLGLSIAYKIVNDHNGRLFVKPNPEGGSIFTFTLPSIL